MRGLHLPMAFLGLAAAIAAGSAAPAAAVCSVFDNKPCAPTVCSVFKRLPCTPEFDPPIGQDLRLTIDSADDRVAASQERADDGTGHKLDTLRALFAALRSCWVPPPVAEARPGMQMSVRLSFKRSGEIIGTPRVTYATPDTSREIRDIYQQAIIAALERCTPMPFTTGLGGAVAGRPIAIRYVDNREQP